MIRIEVVASVQGVRVEASGRSPRFGGVSAVQERGEEGHQPGEHPEGREAIFGDRREEGGIHRPEEAGRGRVREAVMSCR